MLWSGKMDAQPTAEEVSHTSSQPAWHRAAQNRKQKGGYGGRPMCPRTSTWQPLGIHAQPFISEAGAGRGQA
jgi:hypothetical protein